MAGKAKFPWNTFGKPVPPPRFDGVGSGSGSKPSGTIPVAKPLSNIGPGVTGSGGSQP